MLKKHFVIFYSPGTFVSEQSEKEIDLWDTEKAVAMATEIIERHGARPYCFAFITRGREDTELNSRVIAKSGMYYLEGQIRTIKEIRKQARPSEHVLLANMESNGWNRAVETRTPWKITRPLFNGDVVLKEVTYAD